ncbi:hypothetical protein BDR26DRAFT_923785 [Obelidium mucronatum]|nr:hypothetical protein BDR26DRAFT_923785 [Obelidium mucronatum]
MPAQGLTGELPDLSAFTALTYLDLENNQYTGNIPDSWSSLGPFNYLNLKGNNLTGFVPSQWTSSDKYSWGTLTGYYSNVVAAMNSDGCVQVFSYTFTKIESMSQTTPNNFTWTASGSLNFGTRTPICNVVVAPRLDGKLEVFSIIETSSTTAISGGPSYHYSQSSTTPFSSEDPFGGWVGCDAVVVRDSSGKLHFMGLGGSATSRILREIKQTAANTNTWSGWSTIASGGGPNTLKQVSSVLNGQLLEVWGVGSGGMKKVVQASETAWGSGSTWVTVSSRVDLAQIRVIRTLNGTVIPFTITVTGDLLYGTSFVRMDTSIQSMQPIFNPAYDTLYLFYGTTSNIVKFRTLDADVWSNPTTVSGQNITNFSVVFRNDGLWQLFGVKGKGPIYFTSPSQIFVEGNCFASLSSQRYCLPLALRSQDCTILHQAFPTLQDSLGSIQSSCAAGFNILYKTDGGGNCVAISMPARGLNGTLPDLSALRFLTYIDLSNNAYSGNFPASWSGYASISYLNINSNRVNGTAPSTWGSNDKITWVPIAGSYTNVQVAQNWDSRLQIFAYTANGIDTFRETTVKNMTWSDVYNFGAGLTDIQEIAAMRAGGRAINVVAVRNMSQRNGVFGGYGHHYAQTTPNNESFALVQPTGILETWMTKPMIAAGAGNSWRMLAIGGNDTSQIVLSRTMSATGVTWSELTNPAPSPLTGVTHLSATVSSGSSFIFAMSPGNSVRYCQIYATDATTARRWVLSSPTLNGTNVIGFQAIATSRDFFYTFILTDSNVLYQRIGAMSDDKPLIRVIDSVEKFQTTRAQTGLLLFVKTTSNELFYMELLYDAIGSWSESKKIGSHITSFTAIVRKDKDWQVFSINEYNAIVTTSQSFRTIESNCITGALLQKNQQICESSTTTTRSSTSSKTTTTRTSPSTNAVTTAPTNTTTTTTDTTSTDTTETSTSETTSTTETSTETTTSTSATSDSASITTSTDTTESSTSDTTTATTDTTSTDTTSTDATSTDTTETTDTSTSEKTTSDTTETSTSEISATTTSTETTTTDTMDTSTLETTTTMYTTDTTETSSSETTSTTTETSTDTTSTSETSASELTTTSTDTTETSTSDTTTDTVSADTTDTTGASTSETTTTDTTETSTLEASATAATTSETTTTDTTETSTLETSSTLTSTETTSSSEISSSELTTISTDTTETSTSETTTTTNDTTSTDRTDTTDTSTSETTTDTTDTSTSETTTSTRTTDTADTSTSETATTTDTTDTTETLPSKTTSTDTTSTSETQTSESTTTLTDTTGASILGTTNTSDMSTSTDTETTKTSTSVATGQTTETSTSESTASDTSISQERSTTTISDTLSTSSTDTDTSTTTTDNGFDFNGNNGINAISLSSQVPSLSSELATSSLSSTMFSTVSSTNPTTTTGTITSTTSTPNLDCLTIKEAFPQVQFDVDCSNVEPNSTYVATKPVYRRRRAALQQRQVNDYIQFQNSRIIHVILPNMDLAGSISPVLGNLEGMVILDLSGNKLSGSIPEELAKCAQLEKVSLENNQLVGSVPAALTLILVSNKAIVNLGTNCLENHSNQKSSCKHKEDRCLQVSLDTRYMQPQYKPLWNALAAVQNDLRAFDRLAEASGNFAFGEYMFQGFRKFAAELAWCIVHHPEFAYQGGR